MVARWAQQYQSQRNQFWPEVHQFFGALPASLFKQSLQLQNNLATTFSDTGQFRDILRREQDHPFLYLHFWLSDDLPPGSSTSQNRLYKPLFLAMVYAFTAAAAQQLILDDASNVDASFLFLIQTLNQQAHHCLAYLFEPDSVFWQHYQQFWNEFAAAWLSTPADGPPTADQVAHKLSYTKIPVTAVALSLGRPALLPDLWDLMDCLNFVYQTLADLSTLRRDVSQRRYTYPIAKTLQAIGLPPGHPISPERILGALALTGVIPQLEQEGLANLDQAQTIANRLGLPTFSAYLATLRTRLHETTALFNIRRNKKTVHPSSSPQSFFAPFVAPLPAAIRMAEAYLLADSTFRESWEVQRRGAFGVPEMTARVFPAGLIVEILCRHGHDMSQTVGELFTLARQTGFRYFDFAGIPPDADDLSLLLRLYPHSPAPELHRQWLAEPLEWLRLNVQATGEIPVWLTTPDFPGKESLPVLWGASCAAVECNVLLGLLTFNADAFAPLIERAVRHLMMRWQNEGLNAVHHYTPLYGIWVGLELVERLAASRLSPALSGVLPRLVSILTGRLQIESRRARLSPQEAALLTLACRSGGLTPAPDWITRLAKTQRYDGSWPAEPLYLTPTRGDLADWYSSRSVTTALCYHALQTYSMSPLR